MSQDTALKLIQTFPGQAHLNHFANRLLAWLWEDLNPRGEAFTESRARALMLAADVLDEPTFHSFSRLVETETGLRVAMYDLLKESGLAENEDAAILAETVSRAAAPEGQIAPSWLALSVAAHAWRSDFRLDLLDPSSPPDPYSPAGQVIKRAAFFIRQQVQRNATERDKLGRKLAYRSTPASLDTLRSDAPIAPLPPHFRTPVPVRYPEYAREPVEVKPEETEGRTPAATEDDSIRISESDLATTTPPVRQPAIRIEPSQLEPPARPIGAPTANVSLPDATVAANTAGLSRSKRRKQQSKVTKLRVLVQEHPDGPGLYGLQVRVSSKGIRRYVAGTTNREGQFNCELPVPLDSGLTYDVDVTWPRDYGGEIERKSITLNADRTLFILPFYRTLKA